MDLKIDFFQILVATDIHLGYGEKHPAKANDSFISFDEILKMGVEEGNFSPDRAEIHQTLPSTIYF